MKLKIPKKFGIVVRISAIVLFITYAVLTSDVETVQGVSSDKKSEVVQNIIPYESFEQLNSNLDFGEKRVLQVGINGLSVDYEDSSFVIQQPQAEIIEVGEKILYIPK